MTDEGKGFLAEFSEVVMRCGPCQGPVFVILFVCSYTGIPEGSLSISHVLYI